MPTMSEELERLVTLRDQGILSHEEFEQAKAKVMAGAPMGVPPPSAQALPPPGYPPPHQHQPPYGQPPGQPMGQPGPYGPQGVPVGAPYAGAPPHAFGVQQMTFGAAIRTCFSKYATVTGRASRAEYWWWTLFSVLLNVGLIPIVGQLISLALLLPSVAVAVRRLHDVDRSGWWQLLPAAPMALAATSAAMASVLGEGVIIVAGAMTVAAVVCSVVILIWLIKPSDPGINRFGPPPVC